MQMQATIFCAWLAAARQDKLGLDGLVRMLAAWPDKTSYAATIFAFCENSEQACAIDMLCISSTAMRSKHLSWMINPPFFCASFFFCHVPPPFPRQFSYPLSGSLSLLFLLEKRQLAGAAFWGRFWTGLPHRKIRKIFFSGARKKVSKGWLRERAAVAGVPLIPCTCLK